MKAPEVPSEEAKAQAAKNAEMNAAQAGYAARMDEDVLSGKSSIPAIPATVVMSLSPTMRRELMSLEVAEARVEKARRIKDLEDDVLKAQKKADNLAGHVAKATEDLKRWEKRMGCDDDNPDARIAAAAKVQILQKEHHTLLMEAVSKRQGLRALELELKDALVQWAEAALEASNVAIPIYTAWKAGAEKILAAKQYEIDHLKPHPGAQPRGQRSSESQTGAAMHSMPEGEGFVLK